MKKAQILSAIALAFALGVVIPVAGASAKVVKVENGQIVSDEDAEGKLQDAITAGKGSCGWHMVGTTKTYYYEQYVALGTKLDDAAKAVEAAEKAQATYLIGQYASIIGALQASLNGATPAVKLPAGVKTEIPETVKTYKDVVAYVNKTVGTLQTTAPSYRDNADTTVYAAYNTAINAFNNKLTATPAGALATAEDAIDTVKDTQATNIASGIETILNDDVDDDATYEEVVKMANNLKSTDNGTCTVAKARNLDKAIDYAQNMLDSADDFTVKDVDNAIANIKKAMNGGTVTDADVEKPADSSIKPGNTGALNSAAEGTASTTVSIVAGLATALTALGAGVVAYRNARRSSEN